jgi:hypothetical protein
LNQPQSIVLKLVASSSYGAQTVIRHVEHTIYDHAMGAQPNGGTPTENKLSLFGNLEFYVIVGNVVKSDKVLHMST